MVGHKVGKVGGKAISVLAVVIKVLTSEVPLHNGPLSSGLMRLSSNPI